MEESKLINKIQYVFVKKILYNEIERWHIDDVIRVVVCEILPEMGHINIRNSEKSASITDVVKYIEKNDKKEGKNKINFGDEHWITKVKLVTKKIG